MGAPMAERLLDVGHTLTVWNRNPDKLKPLIARGATAASSPAAATEAAELTITMLTDAAAQTAVYGGPNGLLAGGGAQKLFVDMSTVRPQAIRALAERVTPAGGAPVECPGAGPAHPARDAKRLGFAGRAAAES